MAEVVILGAGVSTIPPHCTFVACWAGSTPSRGVAELPVELDPVQHLGGRGRDGQVRRGVPTRPGVREEGHRLPPGEGGRDPAEGRPGRLRGAVDIEFTSPDKAGTTQRIRYDYLINATGPKLRFEATEGMGPGGYTQSVCTADHAVEANERGDRGAEDRHPARPW